MSGGTGILVLGMHRSGTSAVTGSLSRLGVALGANLLAPGDDNPKGYFEHRDAVRIDDALLQALDRRWDDLRPLPDGWTSTAAAGRARQAIGELLARDFSQAPLFALKDPRMCIVLPVWLDAMREAGIAPRVLLVARHPAEVAASILKRNDWPAVVSEQLWLQYMLAAERDSRGCRRAAMTYDRLLASPAGALQAALDALRLDAEIGVIDERAIADFVSADDRHHAGGRGASSGTKLEALAGRAYACFEQGMDQAALDAVAREFDAALRPVSEHVDALSGRVVALHREADGVRAELAHRQSELNAQLDWAQSAVAEREVLQARAAACTKD